MWRNQEKYENRGFSKIQQLCWQFWAVKCWDTEPCNAEFLSRAMLNFWAVRCVFTAYTAIEVQNSWRGSRAVKLFYLRRGEHHQCMPEWTSISKPFSVSPMPPRQARQNWQPSIRAARRIPGDPLPYERPPRIFHDYQVTKPSLSSSSSPLDIFNHFWDGIVLDIICRNTNQYAHDFFLAHPTYYNQIHWKNVTRETIRTYFGILIFIGILQLPRIDDFWRFELWATFMPLATRPPLSLIRFQLLRRFFHVSNSRVQLLPHEWFKKLEPISTMIRLRTHQIFRLKVISRWMKSWFASPVDHSISIGSNSRQRPKDTKSLRYLQAGLYGAGGLHHQKHTLLSCIKIQRPTILVIPIPWFFKCAVNFHLPAALEYS